jgi:hypothetical protein
MKRINIHLSPKQIASLKAKAKASGLTVAEIVRRAVDIFLAK